MQKINDSVRLVTPRTKNEDYLQRSNHSSAFSDSFKIKYFHGSLLYTRLMEKLNKNVYDRLINKQLIIEFAISPMGTRFKVTYNLHKQSSQSFSFLDAYNTTFIN